MKPRFISLEDALEKARRFCAYRERCHQEVKDKLYEMGLHRSDVDQVLSRLIQEDFLNESRFVEAYVSGKFRINGWGRRKIMLGLKAHRVSPWCLKSAFDQLDQAEYEETLRSLLRRKLAALKGDSDKRIKAARFATSRGFENELIIEVLNELLPH